jgi:ankyrin repeat protein
MKYIKLFEEINKYEDIKRLGALFLKSPKEIKDLFWGQIEFREQPDYQLLKDLLETQLIDLADDKNKTALLYRVINFPSDLETIKILIDNKINLEITGRNSRTALIEASRNNYKVIVKLLIDSGANLESKDEDGATSLIYALGDNYETSKILIDAGADVNAITSGNNSALHSLIKGINLKEEKIILTKLLIEKGADINWQGYLAFSPLHLAVNEGIEEIVKILIDNGANINAIDDWGFTPLHNAARDNNKELCKLLLENGADINIKANKRGSEYTPLTIAIFNNQNDIVPFLVKAGADINVEMPRSEKNPIDFCFSNEIEKEKPNEELLKYLMTLQKIDISINQVLKIKDYNLREEFLSKKIDLNLDFDGLVEEKELVGKYFTYVKTIDDITIFHRNQDLMSSSTDLSVIYLKKYSGQDNLFSENYTFIPLSLEHPYTFYYEKAESILFLDFDKDSCYYGDIDDILEDYEDRDNLGYWRDDELPINNKEFKLIKKDEYVKNNLPSNLKYDSSKDEFELTLNDYTDLAPLFSEQENTVTDVLNWDLWYDWYEKYDDSFFDYLKPETEELLRNIIIRRNPEIEIEEIESSSDLQNYIEDSENEVAEKIKECIEKAYNRTYENSYQSANYNAVISRAYEWLTANTFNKKENPLQWVESKLVIKDIDTEHVITSLFGDSSDFIDGLINIGSTIPELDFERIQYNVDFDVDDYQEQLIEMLEENDILDDDIYQAYKSKISNK